MRDEMTSLKKLGAEVQKLREARGLSRRDVAEALHIREQFIDAIENGAEDRFPAPVYIRGFIRNYVEYLDARDLWDTFASEVPLEHPLAPPGANEVACPPVSHGFRRLSRSWIYLLVAFLVGTAGFFIWKEWDTLRTQVGRPEGVLSGDRVRNTPSPQIPSSGPSPVPATVVSSETLKLSSSLDQRSFDERTSADQRVTLSPDGLSPGTPSSADGASEDYPWLQEMANINKSRDAEGKDLLLLATASCWVRVTQRDKVLFEGTMKAGEERRYVLSGPVSVRMGNSAAMTATWAGQTQNLGKGRRSGVITATFAPDGTMTVK